MYSNRSIHRAGIAVIVLLLSCTTFSAAVAEDEINTAAVHQAVGVLRNEIEQIRLVMGERPPRSRSFSLADVEPRQVYFQAQTLFRKCNNLAQEVAGISRQAPAPAPAEQTTPGDVMKMITAAREQLGHVKVALGITEPAEIPSRQRRKQDADVMHDIIEAGYVLNQLAAQPYDWTQIYDRVNQAIVYLGGALPEDKRFPELEPFECCKMPQDVYQRLAEGMEAARPIAEGVNLKLVRVIPGTAAEGGADTGTVFDLTTTLVSDIGELTLRLDGDDIAGPEYPRPARIFPAHVYQLAGVLRAQIDMLVAAGDGS